MWWKIKNNFYISHYFSHWEEVINLGTENETKYSSTKCYNDYYLFKEERTNISYCIYYYNVDNDEDIKNCNEKKIKIRVCSVWRKLYSCLSWYRESVLLKKI